MTNMTCSKSSGQMVTCAYGCCGKWVGAPRKKMRRVFKKRERNAWKRDTD